MKVLPELKENIQLAIISALDTSAEEENIDSIIADAIVSVLEEYKIPGNKKTTLVAVRYVGKRDWYSDALFGTGDWKKDQTKMVPADVAPKMFEHQDVYQEGDEESAKVVVDVKEKDEEKEREERLTEMRNMVQNMTRKAAVNDFVATNYNGLKIPEEFVKLDEMKAFAIGQIDRYGI